MIYFIGDILLHAFFHKFFIFCMIVSFDYEAPCFMFYYSINMICHITTFVYFNDFNDYDVLCHPHLYIYISSFIFTYFTEIVDLIVQLY